MFDAHHFDRRFDRLERFLFLIAKGYHFMTAAFDRLSQSVSALADQVDANDTELASLAEEIRSMNAASVTDDQLTALADKIDASRGNLKTAADAASDALAAHPAPGPDTTVGADTTTDTLAGGNGADTLVGGNGDDTLTARPGSTRLR